MVDDKQIGRVMWAIRLMRQEQANITAASVLTAVSGYWTGYTGEIVQECMSELQKRGFHITEYPPGIPPACIIVDAPGSEQDIVKQERSFQIGDKVRIVQDDLFSGVTAIVTGCYFYGDRPYVTTDFSGVAYYESALERADSEEPRQGAPESEHRA